MTTTIFEAVEDALETLGVDFACGLYITETGDALPDQFMVYTMIASPPVQHADEGETLRTYRVQVNVYDRAGLASLPDVDAAMVAAGFAKSNKYQLPFDQDTGHHGLAQEYTYLEEP